MALSGVHKLDSQKPSKKYKENALRKQPFYWLESLGKQSEIDKKYWATIGCILLVILERKSWKRCKLNTKQHKLNFYCTDYAI